jgi:two-component system, chemotaxis family, sensor kinase CheA
MKNVKYDKNRRTLKKKISRAISWSISISVLFFSILLILFLFIFTTGFAKAASYYLCSNVADEMSSPIFLKQLDINDISNFNPAKPREKAWLITLDKSYGSNFFNPKSHNDTDHVINAKKNKFSLINMAIVINGKIIYDNMDENSRSMKSQISILKSKPYSSLKFSQRVSLRINNYLNSKSVSPILNSSRKQVGTVTMELNRDFLSMLLLVFLFVIIGLGFLALLAAKIITHFFVNPIVRPLTQLQERMDALSREKLEETLNTPIVFEKAPSEIEDLANSTNQIMFKIKRYMDLLENQNNELEAMTSDLKGTNDSLNRKNIDMENLMNSVGQGFLTFGRDLIISGEYSNECKRIFGANIENKKLSELLYPDNDVDSDFVDAVLNKIFKETSVKRIALYIPLLPSEIRINNHFINIEYKLIDNKDPEASKSLMVILTDITDRKSLEAKMEEEKSILKMVVKAVTNYDTFTECIEDYKEFCNIKINEILNSDIPSDAAADDVLRNIHTFKGNFSQFDTYNTVSGLHNMENILIDYKTQNPEYTIDDLRSLVEKFNMLEWLEKDIEILKDVLGDNFFNRNDSITVNKKNISEIEEKMLKLLSHEEYKLLIPYIQRLKYKPVKSLLASYPEYVEKLAERMGKSVVPFDIEGDNIDIDADIYHNFMKTLVHVFRNCVDHGIETMEERVLNGKSENGSVSCKVLQSEGNLIITICDDGRGIDFNKLKEKAQEKGLYSSEELSVMNEDKLIELIFNKEFSTKDTVSEISGRGVGLYAVKNEIDKLGGNVTVKTHPNEGTEFIFTLPINKSNSLPKISLKNILSSLEDTALDFMKKHIDTVPQADSAISYTDKVSLNKITSLVNMRGILDGIFAISLNENLAKSITKSLMIDDISEEEECSYIEDAVSEFSNIILGNSIRKFGEMGDLITIGTPTIICYNGASIKHESSRIISTSMKWNDFSLILSFISMNDNSLLKEEDLWQTF